MLLLIYTLDFIWPIITWIKKSMLKRSQYKSTEKNPDNVKRIRSGHSYAIWSVDTLGKKFSHIFRNYESILHPPITTDPWNCQCCTLKRNYFKLLVLLVVGIMLGVVFQQGQTGLLYIIQTQANYHKPLPAVKSNMLHEEYRDCQCCILPPPDSLDTIWQHTPDLEVC